MAKWKRVSFENAKVHVVDAKFYDALVADMALRDCPLRDFAKIYAQAADTIGPNPKDLTDWGIDMGGMAHMNRPQEKFLLGGMPLQIPSEDVALLLHRLQHECPLRRFDSKPLTRDRRAYYKLHGFMQAIVMTPHQRASLLRQLANRLPFAEAQAHAFYLTVKTPTQILDEANKGKSLRLVNPEASKFTRFEKPHGQA